MLKSFYAVVLCGLLVIATAASADTLGAIGGGGGLTDAYNWGQLGPDGTVVGANFGVVSNHGLSGAVSLAGPNSITAVQCPAAPSCSWTGGFNPGDTTLWTSAGDGTANGPLHITFGSGVNAVGTALQSDVGAYTAIITVFNGNTALGSYTVTSDSNGDVVYLGLVDFNGNNITSATFALTSCSDIDCDTRDFAIDAVQVQTPEPASLALFASGLVGLGGIIRRRR